MSGGSHANAPATPHTGTRGAGGRRPGRRPLRACALLALMALATLLLAACGREESKGGGGGGGGEVAKVTKLTLLVGTEPGGGFDQTARTLGKVATDTGAASNVQVQNIPGAGNTIALARLVNQKGTSESMQMMGLGLIGGIYSNKSENTLEDTTPIASLIQEAAAIVVPGDSEYEDMADLAADWKANPRDISAGAGSSPGGPDHIAVMVTAQAAGVDPKQVKYIGYDGGGELNTALLGGKVDMAASGLTEITELIKSGRVKALAVTTAERFPALPDVPTLKESGIDTEFVNWRGVVAPPGIGDADREKLTKFVTDVHGSPEWKAALKKNGWTDFFQTGDEFEAFAESETKRVSELMSELGLGT